MRLRFQKMQRLSVISEGFAESRPSSGLDRVIVEKRNAIIVYVIKGER